MYSPYEIAYEKVDNCPLNGRVKHYFQIVYILSGYGKQKINGHIVPYSTGDLLLLTPADLCSFDVLKTTEFLFVSFQKHYIENNAMAIENSLKLAHLLRSASTTKGCVLYNQSDKHVVKILTEAILQEQVSNRLYSKPLIAQLMNALILLVARNLALAVPEELVEISEAKIVDILQYIQSNITNPEGLKIKKIAHIFGLSSSYVSRYFKKHSQQTLQDYIAYCRLNLIENKLLYTSMRMGEIATDLGFTDESHLNRFFKKRKNLSPSEFRKNSLLD